MGSKKLKHPEYHPEMGEESITSLGLEMYPLYRVYLLNDDYTPMDFVIEVLERYFSMTHNGAMEVMIQVHQSGRGICGVFTQEIAETKVLQVNEYSRRNQHPLLCQMEQSGTH